MLSLRELIESNENAIEKVKNSQEYKIGNQSNRYALLNDLTEEREHYIALIQKESDLDLSLIDIEIRNKLAGNRARVVLI